MILKYFLALRQEIEMVMNEEGKIVAELSDEKWLWDLPLLCHIIHHVNDLNISLPLSTETHFFYIWGCYSF
jgi:hypothetical protein